MRSASSAAAAVRCTYLSCQREGLAGKRSCRALRDWWNCSCCAVALRQAVAGGCADGVVWGLTAAARAFQCSRCGWVGLSAGIPLLCVCGQAILWQAGTLYHHITFSRGVRAPSSLACVIVADQCRQCSRQRVRICFHARRAQQHVPCVYAL